MRAIRNYLVIIGLLLLVGSSCANPPTVTGIVPSTGVNSGMVSITDLAGADFLSGAGVMLTPVNADPVHKGSITDGGGSIPFLNSPISVYVSGPYVYVASYGSNTLEIVDVIDPGAPVHAGSISDGEGGAFLLQPESVFVSGFYAYVTSSGSSALEIVDVTDRSNPFHVSSIGDGEGGALLDYPEGVFVSGNYAYVASAGSNALEIVDITAPEVPFHAGSISDGDGGALLSQPESVYVSGNFAYVTSFGSNALEIVDVTDPTAPVHAGSISDGDGGALLNQPESVYVAGKYAYVTSGGSNALEIVDITDPTAPVHAGSISDGDGGALLSGPMSVSISGNYAYVASLSNALEVVDVSNPSSPVHAGSISDSEGAALLKMPYSVFISGNYAYIASFYDNALEIVDIGTITGTSVNVGSAEHILCSFDLAGKSPGAYNVVVTNPDGQSGTLGSGFTVTEPVTAPVAAFSGTPTTGPSPLIVAFTDASTGDPTSWSWDFGDGDSTNSTVQNPVHTYTNVGSYTVTLTAGNAAGSDDETKEDYITVIPPSPVAAFSGIPITGDAPLAVTFTDESTGDPTGRVWYFGDEDYSDPWVLVNPEPEWSARRDASSVVLPDGSIVLMGGDEGSADYKNDVWRSIDRGATWTLVNASAGWSPRSGHRSVVLPDWSIVLMGGREMNDVWRSKDRGATWTLVNASAGWKPRRGQSSVVLPDGSIVVMGGYNGIDNQEFNDVWRSTDKGATWALVSANAEWGIRERHSSVTLQDGSIVVLCGVSSSWELGYGWGYDDAWRSTDMGKTWTQLPADFPYDRWDHSSVVMPDGSVVTFGGLSYDSSIQPVNLFRPYENSWTIVNWSILPIPLYGQTSVVLPDGGIIVMGGVENNGLTNNVWKFQPAGSTDQNPSHTYAEPGLFNVTLQVYSESGFNTLRKAEYISVSEPVIPVAAFSGDPKTGKVPLTVAFTDASTGDPTSWTWDFGDGDSTNSTLQNPVHTYTNAGIFTVTLTAGNAAGSDDEVRTDYIEVKAEPFAAFTATPVTGTVPLIVTFKDDSIGDITSWFWDFGDGGSSSDQNPVHTYESTGTYSVLLTVNWDGGWDEESRIEYITVNPPPPVAAFSGAPREGAAPLMVAFTDASSGEITGSAWFFGDETYSAAWTERTASAGWWGRSSHTSVVMPDGSIVLMGGDGGDLMDDVWRSTNGGYTWTEIIGSDRWTGRAHHSSVTLADNRIVLMGGYDGISRKNDTWQSTDYGATWTRMTESAGWTERSSHQGVVMPDGSIILTGGGDNTGTGIWNDAWRSTDHGATWTRMTADAEWAARYQHSSVALPDGSILVMGGLDSSGNKLNDVWRSTDNGGTWTQLQDAPWSARFGHSCIVMPDGSIVLTGGRDAGGYRNDVWRSKDKGVTWTQLPDAGWTARNEHSNVVMPDGSIVLIGGMTDISPYYMGDVWRLQPAGSVTKHPYYTYTEPGIYNVTLQVYNGGGFDSVRMDEYINVTVPVAPVADFEGDPLTGTVPLTVFFTSQVSTGIGPFTYSWDFNNDGTEDSIEQDPIYTYESAGTYTVRLMVTNDVGTDEEIKTDYITVDPAAPIAAFAGNPLSGTVPLTVVFTDLSMRDPASWSWEFGDGDISTEQHPAHTYDSAGTFTVTLTVTNTVDSSVEIKTDYITVIPTPPVAAFSGTPTTGKAPLTVAFSDDSTGGEPAGWAWFFGDEDFSESWTQQTADAGWNLHGHCSVAMPDGNIILMGFREDSLGFEVWRSVNNGTTWARRSSTDSLTLQYQTSVALPDGNIVMMGGYVAPVTTNDVYMSSDNGATWWNFGSGEWTARAKHSSVVMPDGSIVLMGGEDILNGEHVSYMNDVWRSTDNGKTWLIQTTSPGWTARSGHSSVAMPDCSIVLMGGIDDGGPLNDVWRSTDNGATWTEVTESAGWTARYGHSSVAMPDGSIIQMGGVDADDIQDDVWRSVDFGATWTQLTGTTWPARFTSSSVAMPDGSTVLIGGKDGDGNAMNDVWRFMPVGSPAENPSHSYTVPGFYNVTLQVYNAGGFDSSRKIEYISVTESAVAPIAAFSATPTAGTAPLTVQFVDMSENDPTSWSWDFGDGDSTNSTDQNPVHTYAVAGTYMVTLTATNSAGSDEEAKSGYLIVTEPVIAPVAEFSGEPRTGDTPLTVLFKDSCTNEPTSWIWDFGDNDSTNSTQQDPVHTYTVAGSYTVTLTATNPAGSDEETKPGYIIVAEPVIAPVAAFSGEPTTGDAPLTVKFTDASTNEPTSWTWDFGDGDSTNSTDQNPVHSFAVPGSYMVTLTATNPAGSDDEAKPGYIIVTEPVITPIADFSGEPTTGTVPLTVQFTDGSTGTRTGWAWFFGDEVYKVPWTEITPIAEWSARSSAASVVMQDGSIVLMGGWDGDVKNDVWRSIDSGITWTEVIPHAEWSAREGHTIVVMLDSSIILMGGYDGDYKNDTWRSTDKGATWAEITISDGWSARYGHTSVVLPDGSIVLMGGVSYDETFMNDVWRSTDNGETWTEMTGSAEWSERSNAATVVMPDGSIVLMGGTRYDDDGEYLMNDVWRSTDKGATWTEMIANARWSKRAYHASVVMSDGSIVLMGGHDPDDKKNDVWRSSDNGVTWTLLTANAEWTERTKFNSIVMPDGNIVLMGGMDSGNKNDVWRLQPVGSSVQNPSHTYTEPGTYSVTLQVYGDSGFNSIRKIGYITVKPLAAPVAAFSGAPTYGKDPLTVHFTDESTGDLSGWDWYFGDETYGESWTEITSGADWPARFEHACVLMQDGSIVLMGGSGHGGGAQRDVWRSMDIGETWTEMTVGAGWSARQEPSSVVMPDGSILLIGGTDISSNMLNDVWRSTDNGASWTEVTGDSEWSKRHGARIVVMPDGSIVLMGGERYDANLLNDVWRSTDNGATWTEINTSAGWSERSYAATVVMPDGSIVISGGFSDRGFKNDVWRSTDNGVTWTEMNASAGWPVRFLHTSVVMPDGSIVLMGGFGNPGGGHKNDIWRSTDNGATWTEITVSDGWSARYGHCSVAIPDGSIVLMGGKDSSGNKLNDVWRLQTVGSSFQNPSHTYTRPGSYQVALQAYNDGGYNSIRKAGYITVKPSTPPVAEFSATPTTGTAPLTVQFTDISDIYPTSWTWDFGDGDSTNSTEQNPVHTYMVTGTYAVTLTATNSAGSDDETKEDYITVGMAIHLSPGWNFVSTPRVLKEGSDTAAVVFGGVDTDGHSVFQYDAATKTWEAMTASSKVKVLDGIWIYSKTATTVGLDPDPNPLIVPPVKPLAAEWNAVGFSDTEPATARDTFASIRAKWSTAIGFNSLNQRYETSYINGGTGIHSDYNLMNPLKGYWLYMIEPGTLGAIGA